MSVRVICERYWACLVVNCERCRLQHASLQWEELPSFFHQESGAFWTSSLFSASQLGILEWHVLSRFLAKDSAQENERKSETTADEVLWWKGGGKTKAALSGFGWWLATYSARSGVRNIVLCTPNSNFLASDVSILILQEIMYRIF